MDCLALRAGALDAARRFFRARGFLEAETPVWIPAPAPEPHLTALPCGGGWLRSSPELALKRLLAAGHERVFEIGPCFRAGERGRRHHPEFTMLEWYRAGADYLDVLADSRALLATVARETPAPSGGRVRCPALAPNPEWARLTVSEAFRRHAGWDPTRTFDADRFDLDLVEKVEPALPADRPCVLLDYPAERAALARCRTEADGRCVAERWELYAGGMEIANAYSEENDAGELRARFAAWNEERRRAGRETYPPDEDFFAALPRMPRAAGVALGFDRLVMLLAGVEEISEVRACSRPYSSSENVGQPDRFALSESRGRTSCRRSDPGGAGEP